MSAAPSAADPQAWPEVWRGGVNTWECDEMGHMNVRFHLARALEGLAGAAARLQLPGAFRAGPPARCCCARCTCASCARRTRARCCT